MLLNIGDNQLTGGVADTLEAWDPLALAGQAGLGGAPGGVVKLDVSFAAAHNRLTGALPAKMASRVQKVDLGYNQLTRSLEDITGLDVGAFIVPGNNLQVRVRALLLAARCDLPTTTCLKPLCELGVSFLWRYVMLWHKLQPASVLSVVAARTTAAEQCPMNRRVAKTESPHLQGGTASTHSAGCHPAPSPVTVGPSTAMLMLCQTTSTPSTIH